MTTPRPADLRVLSVGSARRLAGGPRPKLDDPRVIPMTLSTGAVNCYGEIVDQESWDLSRFGGNPVALYEHDRWVESVGFWEGTRVEEGELRAELHLYTDDLSPEAGKIWGRYCQGGPVAASVGFYPGRIDKVVIGGIERPKLYSCLLEEASVVKFGADPGAVARRLAARRRALATPGASPMDPIAKIEEAIASLDAEANAPAIAMLREALAALAEKAEMADKGDEKKAEDPAAVAMAAEEQKALAAKARMAEGLSAEVSTLRTRLAAVEAERATEARNRVLAKHRDRGALTPAIEKDADRMRTLSALSVDALDDVLSMLPGAPAAVKPRTPGAIDPTGTTPEPTEHDLEMGRRFGVKPEAIKAAAAATRR